mgnify:CR=1 FL=1
MACHASMAWSWARFASMMSGLARTSVDIANAVPAGNQGGAHVI